VVDGIGRKIVLLDLGFGATILQSVPVWYARLLRLGGYWGMIVRG
jgi:hypothetical protein